MAGKFQHWPPPISIAIQASHDTSKAWRRRPTKPIWSWHETCFNEARFWGQARLAMINQHAKAECFGRPAPHSIVATFRWRLPMISGRSLGNAALVLTLLGASLFDAAEARADVKNVKITLDWIIQGTHAPFFIAQEKGYFKSGGVTVDAIDAGNGATNVAVKVAGGAYQFGWVDIPSMILFNAKNPTTPLIAVYVSFDTSPLAFITRKSAGIRQPADLDGKKIAGGPGTAVHDTAS